MTDTHLRILGSFFSLSSIYLIFLDKIPFGAPWGIVMGVGAFFCLRELFNRTFKDEQ